MPAGLKAFFGVLLLIMSFCSIIYIDAQRAKSADAIDLCRDRVGAANKVEPYTLPISICFKDFPNSAKPFEKDIRTYERNRTVMGWAGVIFGLWGLILFVPVAAKSSWRFFLNRVAELSAAIRGKQ